MMQYNIDIFLSVLYIYFNDTYTGGANMAETLGERIRKARVRYGMSQTVLAARIGISKTAMNNIELGDTADPAASRVREIARALKVSADYLLGLTDEEGD